VWTLTLGGELLSLCVERLPPLVGFLEALISLIVALRSSEI